MLNKIRLTLLILTTIALLNTSSFAQSSVVDIDMDTINIVIQKQDGSTVELSVKLATTELQIRRGLMFVKELDGYDGMLFDFGEDQLTNMWMKNTFIPLDMLFFTSDRKLACIIENTVPHDETLLNCCKPVRYVLEIGGGRARKLGITTGDIFEYVVNQ